MYERVGDVHKGVREGGTATSGGEALEVSEAG